MRIYSGGPLEVPQVNLAQTFFETVRKYPDRVGIRARDGPTGPFRAYTYREAEQAVREVAGGLLALGIRPGDRVAVLADTSWEWVMSDYGILAAGGVSVTVYPTLTAEQVAYLLNDSGSRAIFVENAKQYEKLEQMAGELSTVEHLITFEDVSSKTELAKRTQTLDTLRASGRSLNEKTPGAVDERTAAAKPDDVATLVYTSGTTGLPKGAILTHTNFISAGYAAMKQLGIENHPKHLAFLPLAHCYGRLSVFFMVILGADIAFSSPRTLGEDLRTFRPTFIVSVPRLYERMYDQIQHKVAEGPENKQNIFRKAEATAKAYGNAISNGGQPGFGLRLKHAVFDKLVYAKLRDALGMTELQFAMTGAAAIRPDLLYFFQGIGINILEGYGLTETAAPSNVNLPHKFKPGTVGPPFPGMEHRLGEDGEVLMKGPNIFQGYYNLDDETREAFTPDGWFRSGDIGEFDDEGYLKIVDRKKEIEVLNTGKNVAPVAVEEAMKASDLIAEAMIVATDRRFVGALIQPQMETLVGWAKKNGVPFDESRVKRIKDPTGNEMIVEVDPALVTNEKVVEAFEGEVAKGNTKLANFEQVRTFRLIPRILTNPMLEEMPLPEGQDFELTPTLKKKRRVIKANYKDLIEDMFSGSA